MEKDLRDAYKALKLLHADLAATRHAKHNADARAAQQLRQNEQLRELLAMREEDFHAQLTRAQQQQYTQSAAIEKTPSPRAGESPEAEPEREHAENPSLEDVAKDQISLLTSVYDLKTQLEHQSAMLVAQDAQFAQDKSEWTLLREAMARQLAELQEAQVDLVRDKKFMDEKFEFVSTEVSVVKSERDALQQQLELHEKVDLSSENTTVSSTATLEEEHERKLQREIKQLQDQYEDREATLLKKLEIFQRTIDEQATEIVVVRKELDMSHALEKKLLQEKAELEKQYEQERTLWKEETEKLTARVDDVVEKAALADDQTHELTRLTKEMKGKQHEIDQLLHDRTDLVQQLQQLRDHATEQLRSHAQQDEARATAQRSEQERLQHELTTLRAGFEAATSANAVKMSALQRSNDMLQKTLVDKTRESEEVRKRETQALDKLEKLERLVETYRDGLTSCREELQTQRQGIVAQQHAAQKEMEQLYQVLVTRFKEEIQHEREKAAAMEQQLATNDMERRRVENDLDHAHDAARTLQEQFYQEAEKLQQVQAALEARERDVVKLTELVDREKTTQRAAYDHKLTAIRAAHDQALERSQNERLHLERHLQALETQLMGGEDHHHASPPTVSASWSTLASEIKALDDFLPQLQLFAGRLQTSFQLCAENATAMDMLSATPSASPTLRADLASLLRLTQQWHELFDRQSLATHVRIVRRSVLATLSQWFEECDESSSSSSSTPVSRPPAFTIDSHEVAIILDNWTRDVDKQQRVAKWLQQIASATSVAAGDSDEDQATLELKDMTRDVKDAFCVLIVPLLRQNHKVSVRVFTRRVCDVKRSFSPDETSWEMRLHVQVKASSNNGVFRRIPSTSSVSSLGSTTSSVASSLSLSSVASASKLHIIQAKLQQMQQQH